MKTLRTATDIRIIWDTQTNDGYYVRYTDEDGSICDESMGCDLDAFAEHRELIDMAVSALAYAGCEAADLDAITIDGR